MDGGSKLGRIIPINFGLKYNPPKLGIQYYVKENPNTNFVHEIILEGVNGKRSDELIDELFTKHKKYVDPKVVSRSQLETLMDKLKTNLIRNSPFKNKENMQENNINKSDDWGLEVNSAQKDFEKDIFSGGNNEDFKNNDKKFMLDDFDMDHEDEKINDGQDIFDLKPEGLDEGLDQDLDHDLDQDLDEDLDDLEDSATKIQDTPVEADATPKQQSGEDNEGEDDSDAIDIDNEEELAARGLKKIQIEGEEEEFLMDQEGNIYNLNGDFIGTTNGDAEEEDGEEEFN
mmetsp:Transcript_29953/g.26516  ORF Transcript_29953/g.26516 Transcript_29953/m.26516 type:complete len:287 (+) Transcript_29953:17-877(+)